MGSRVIIFVVLTVGSVWLQTCTASQCSQQMDTLRTCVRNEMSKDTSDPTASTARRQQMQNELSSCASQSGCQSPLPSSGEQSARQSCFNDARNEMRRQLETCVRKTDTGFTLPGDDNDKDAYWQFVLLRSFAAMRTVGDNSRNRNRNNKDKWGKASGNQAANDICGNDDRKRSNMVQCVKTRGTFNKTSGQSTWRKNSCKIKRQCNQVNAQCQTAWDNKQKPALCDCVANMKRSGLSQIQDTYNSCLTRRGVRNVQNNDDGRTVIQRMLNGWCPQGKLNQQQMNQTDPCRRRPTNGNGNQNGRPNNGNSGSNNNGAWNSGRGGSSNNGGSWNGGNSGSSSSNSGWNGQNSGSSSSNWNSGSSSSSNVDYPYDDGSSYTSTDYNTNSNVFSSFLGGSDPLSSFTGGGDSSGLLGGGGGLLSSFTGGGGGLGGGLLSSFTGGGSPLGGGGLLSSFTGGGSPLGGGGGGLMDAASSMGAFGGAGDMFSGFGGDSGNLLGSLGSLGF